MSARKDQDPRRPTRGPRGGFGWFIILLVGGGILAVFIWAPQLPQQLLGGAAQPRNLGDEPLATRDQDSAIGSRAVNIEARSLADDVTGLARRPIDEAPESAAPVIETPEVPQFRDAARGISLLERAETAYASYQWDEARRLANSMRGLDIPPAERLRAEDIIAGTQRLAELFQVLGTRDELVRNLETHPSLVELDMRGRASRGLPVNDMSSRTPIETDDPVAFVRQRLNSAGEVVILFENNIASVVRADTVTEVRPAGVDRVISERRQLMEQRVAEFEQDMELRNDPMAWYEAAKFAFRNRIDDRVVEMLDRALLLAPDLGQVIREDAAQDWFTRMVMAIEGGNRQAATGFMRQIQNYQDTLIYAQARAYYDGNLDQLRQAREEALAQRRAQQESARERRLERAQVTGDEQAVEQIQREIRQVEERDDRITAAPPATGDLARANESFDRGMAIYQEAQSMGATRERDNKYREARKHFLAALEIYAAAVERGDTSLEARMTQTNQLQYACMKYARSF
ncbi:MAG: hypothetical protein EA402_02145 [Planctomycetota bacterium]|nr:MAG: hypothetical protein EA402_02145 [Planctomycetota bacterium]